jgi:hypothetical protein
MGDTSLFLRGLVAGAGLMYVICPDARGRDRRERLARIPGFPLAAGVAGMAAIAMGASAAARAYRRRYPSAPNYAYLC